jgi:hypothetical protein
MSSVIARKASWIAGGLLVVTAMSGLISLSFLSEEVTLHFYALTLFLILDLVLAGFVLLRPSKTSFTLVAIWSILRIALFIGDISQASILQAPSAEDNPLEFQMLEFIVIIQIGLIGVAWKARSALIRQSTS